MEKVRRTEIIASISIGIIILLTVAGIPNEVFHHSKTSTIFGVSAFCLITGFSFPLLAYQKQIKVKWADGLIFAFLIYYLLDFKYSDSLSNVANACLLLLAFTVYCLNKLDYRIIYWFCILALLLLSIRGYLQYFEFIPSHNRYFLLTGPYYSSAIYAIMLALLAGIIINTLILYRKLFRKYRFRFTVVIISLIVSLPLLALTYSRAAYLAFIISILFTLYYRFLSNQWSKKIMIGIIGGTTIILIFIGTLYALKPHSADGRILIWKISEEMIKDKPMTGFGSGGFAANYMYYQARYMNSEASPYERNLAGNTHLTFNEPLLMAIEHGVIGLLIYIAFIIWVLFSNTKKNRILIISKSILVAILSWGMFAYPGHAFPVITIMILALACYLNKRNTRKQIIISGKLQKKIMITTILCMALFLGNNLGAKLKAYHELFSFTQKYKLEEIPNQLNSLSKFAPVMENDPSFLYLYCKAAKIAQQEILFFQLVEKLEKTLPTSELFIMKGEYLQQINRYEEAEEAYTLAANMEPAKQTARGRLAVLYKETGRKTEAIKLVREILTEKVKIYGFGTYELHNKLKKIFEDEIMFNF